MYFGRSNQKSITFPSKLWSRLVLLHRKLIDACAEARWRSSRSGRRSCVGWNPDNPASATFCGLHPPCPRHTHARHRRVYPPEKTKTRHRDLHTVSHGRALAAVTPCLCAFPSDHQMAPFLIRRSPPANELNHEYVCCAQPGNTRLPPGTGVPHSGSLTTL